MFLERRPVCLTDAAAYTLQEELTLVWLLLITTVLTSFFIQRFNVQYIPPSGAAMILGMMCAGVFKVAGILTPACKLRHKSSLQQFSLGWIHLEEEQLHSPPVADTSGICHGFHHLSVFP